MKELLIEEFKNNTLFWLLASSIVGGIIGASLKTIFEFLIPHKYRENKESKENFRQYCHYLLLAAKDIDRRLDFILTEKSYGECFRNDGAKLSLLYSFGQYFGWCKIIQHNALENMNKKPKRFKKFFIVFFDTFKALSHINYFEELADYDELHKKGGVIPVHEVTRIGFAMLANVEENKTVIKMPVLNYNDFISIWHNDKRFIKKFNDVIRLIDSLDDNPKNLAWNRLILFSTSLKILIHNIDNAQLHSEFNQFNNLKMLHPTVYKRFEQQLNLKNGIVIPKQYKS